MSREKGRVVLKNARFTGKRLDTGRACAMRGPEAMAQWAAKLKVSSVMVQIRSMFVAGFAEVGILEFGQ